MPCRPEMFNKWSFYFIFVSYFAGTKRYQKMWEELVYIYINLMLKYTSKFSTMP